MTDLADLLQQSHQIAERMRVLAEEHRVLRTKYRLLNERHGILDSLSGPPRSQEPSKPSFSLTKISTWPRLAIPQNPDCFSSFSVVLPIQMAPPVNYLIDEAKICELHLEIFLPLLFSALWSLT